MDAHQARDAGRVAGAGIEERVTGEQRRLAALREQADMRERMARRVEAFKFHAAADADHITLGQPTVDIADDGSRRFPHFARHRYPRPPAR